MSKMRSLRDANDKPKIKIMIQFVLALSLCALAVFMGGCAADDKSEPPAPATGTTSGAVQSDEILYENTQYGFTFSLPESWKGYTTVTEQWTGTTPGDSGDKTVQTGPEILIRHPEWTAAAPRQDIPVMVFTREQWDALQKEAFYVSAAPIGPSELGSNSKYVFALPPRYNFAFETGYQEVDEIVTGDSFTATEKMDGTGK